MFIILDIFFLQLNTTGDKFMVLMQILGGLLGFNGGSHGFWGERKEDQSWQTEYKGRGGRGAIEN